MTVTSDATSPSSSYALTAEFEILGVLRSLVADQLLIHLRAPAGNGSMMTTLLDIETEKKTLIFDGTSDPNLLKAILAAKRVLFDASQNGVHISFKCGPAESLLFEGRPALRLPFPGELTRLQRRDSFRVATPVNNPVLCTIPLKEGAVTLPLEDLSIGGLGASDSDHALLATVGQLFPGCRLNLPDTEPLEVHLRLVHVREFERADKPQRHLGFAFQDLRGVAAARVQRYIIALEREALARERGFS